MRSIHVGFVALAGLAATLLAQAPPSSSTPSQPPAATAETPQASFGEAVEVRVVNVDVEVTDRDGNPVNGLDKQDFELSVDGKPVPISNFDRSSRPVPPSAPEAPASAPATGPTAAPMAGPERPRLFVWIDDLHLIPAHRNRVLKELESQLEDQEKLGVDVGIVRFDRSLQLLRAPGDRNRPIARVIGELERHAGTGIFAASSRGVVFSEIENIYQQRGGCEFRDQMEEAAWRYADPLRNETQDSLGALREFVASMAGLPGRKAVLYVADALPLYPGEEAFLYVDQLCGRDSRDRPRRNLGAELRDTSAQANDAGVTFYTFQAGGLPVYGDASSLSGGLDMGNMMAARGNDQDTLQQMASDTGGKALLDRNKVAPLLEQVGEDFATSYSLGFSPQGPADGKVHTIVVRVKREGVKVRYRDSFTDRSNVDRRSDRLLAALRFGSGENPLGIQIEVAPTKAAGKDFLELPLRIAIPAAQLVFPPVAGSAARIEIALAVSDDRGRTAPVERRTLDIPRDKLAADLSQSMIRIPFDLKVRKGPTNVAVAVRDLVGDTESLLAHSLDLR